MQEPNESKQEPSRESFPDESSGDGSFQLEKLEKYPADLPYDPAQMEGQNASDSGIVTVSPTLVATIKEDLERSRIQKTRQDTLEDSIQRLKGKLQSSDSSIANNSDLSSEDDVLSTDELAATNEMREHPVFNEQPVLLSSVEVDSPHSSAPLSIDVSGIPDPQSAEAATLANNSSEIESMIDNSDTPAKHRSRRLMYGLVGLLLLAMAGAGGWYALHRTTIPNPTGATTAQVTDGAKANGEAEALAKKSPEGDHSEHSDATSNPTAEQHNAQVSHDAQASSAPHSEHSDAASKTPNDLAKAGTVTHGQDQSASTNSTGVRAGASTKIDASATAQHDKHASSATKEEKSTSHITTAASSSTASHAKTSEVEKPSTKQSASSATLNKSASKTGLIASNDTKNNSASASSSSQGAHPEKNESSSGLTVSKKQDKQEQTSLKESHDKTAATSTARPMQAAKDAAAGDKKSSAKNTSSADIDGKKTSQYETKLIAKPVIKNMPTSPKGVFTVQVYSTPNQEDADDWMHRLQKKNVDGAFISKQNVRGTTYYRVRFGQYTTKQEAESAAMSSGFHSSWVDRVK